MKKSPFGKKKNRKNMTTDSSVNKEESVESSKELPLEEASHGLPEERVEEEAEVLTASDLQQESMQRQVDDWKGKYMLLLAESENARKRLQKEKQQLIGYAVSNVIVDLLAPLDQMEQALGFAKEMSDEIKNWALGFDMILEQFKTSLAGHGVQPFDAKGHFDPHEHEAIEMIETEEVAPGTIIEQCMRGYRMGDRVIRAAKVKVAKAPQVEESKEEPSAEKEETTSQKEQVSENESKENK